MSNAFQVRAGRLWHVFSCLVCTSKNQSAYTELFKNLTYAPLFLNAASQDSPLSCKHTLCFNTLLLVVFNITLVCAQMSKCSRMLGY